MSSIFKVAIESIDGRLLGKKSFIGFKNAQSFYGTFDKVEGEEANATARLIDSDGKERYSRTTKIDGDLTIGDKYDDFAADVYSHGTDHYEKDGWDIIVETMTLEEIAEELRKQKVRKLSGAIGAIKKIGKMQAANRTEIQNA